VDPCVTTSFVPVSIKTVVTFIEQASVIIPAEGFIPALSDTANTLYGTEGASNICGEIE